MEEKERNSQKSMQPITAFLLNVRAFKIWWKECPELFISTGSYAVISAIFPYIAIWFSARIINELAGSRDVQQLTGNITTLLAVTAGVSLAKALARRWKEAANAGSVYKEFQLYTNKFLDMDFCSADYAHTYALLAQIQEQRNWNGWGFASIQRFFETMLTTFIQILGAMVLTVSLFTSRTSAAFQNLAFLNHPAFILLLLAVMAAGILTSAMLSNRSDGYWIASGSSTMDGNRYFGHFGMGVEDHKRAVDMRLYRQDVICRKYLNTVTAFSVKGELARCARGIMGFLTGASAAVSYIFIGLAYVFVCLKAYGGAFGIGSVTQYISAITAMAGGISTLMTLCGRMITNGSFLKTTFEFLDIPNDMYQGSLTIEKRSDRKYDIEFRNVSFRYPGSQAWALRHVSLKFRVGEKMAVVGENGSGKTTFIKLLCRLYDPTEGEILLNGINIRKYNYLEYLSVFSVVFQDFKLLAFSLGQNVAASEKYDKERAEKCLREAGLEERLKKMPNGLETYIYKDFDNSGVAISGGEEQKIAIARALYKDAPFIILDEPTAALDPIAEAEIYARFNELVGDKTAIYISHRLSSCRFCDEIMVFDQGNVVQKGRHEELVAEESGKYHQLWAAQAQYYQ